VDAACSGSPGQLEYRGVYTDSEEEFFRAGPFPDGTNNVGEFLAIVHALTWLEKHNTWLPIYSDSRNAISWVYTGKCQTSLKHTARNAPLFAIIHSAENWLAENELREDAVLKWDTELWGENPADFGRK
jgi:ribonuclease HI